MDYSQKRLTATVVLGAAAGVTLWGFRQLYIEAWGGHVSMFTWVVFFGGAAIGVAAGIARKYFGRMKAAEAANSQKAAIEILAEIGRQNMAKRQRKQ